MNFNTKHPLRKSCGFCRARKIKCSNEEICEACRKQNVECIYDFEPAKSSLTSVSEALPASSTLTASNPLTRTTNSSNSPEARSEYSSIESQLETMFSDVFSTTSNKHTNPCRETLSIFNQTIQSSRRNVAETTPGPFYPGSHAHRIGSNKILSLFTQDIVSVVVSRFGMLGCYNIDRGGAQFFIEALRRDDTESMFDPATPGGNPLTEYSNRKITQTIDVWFSMHPLSFLISKTLLLYELRAGTHDEILLAIILADANFFVGDDVAVARGYVLLRWATSKFRNRFITAESSLGMSNTAISTAQALTLLGWNALCQSQARRATCHIGLASKLSTEIRDSMPATASTSSSRINGIEIFDAEKEVLSYIWWTTFTITLWSFMQMGHWQPQLIVPTDLTSFFLPVDETSSVLIRLDQLSDNLSTLERQKEMIREMWPPAHVSSVVANIYTLYPHESEQPREYMKTMPWQEAPLRALQQICKGSGSHGLPNVCRNVYDVLWQTIQILGHQVGHEPSRTLVRVLYHTIAIHFLFPQ